MQLAKHSLLADIQALHPLHLQTKPKTNISQQVPLGTDQPPPPASETFSTRLFKLNSWVLTVRRAPPACLPPSAGGQHAEDSQVPGVGLQHQQQLLGPVQRHTLAAVRLEGGASVPAVLLQWAELAESDGQADSRWALRSHVCRSDRDPSRASSTICFLFPVQILTPTTGRRRPEMEKEIQRNCFPHWRWPSGPSGTELWSPGMAPPPSTEHHHKH